MQTLLVSLVLLTIITQYLYKGECYNGNSKQCGALASAAALYVFGDSLVDCGNNNFIPSSVSKYNYFPYGVDFLGGLPSGRATNGRIFPDFLAEYLGLPYAPPYRSPYQLKSLTGYNYASAGCGILPDTGHTFGCNNLDTQVKDFQMTVEKELVSSFPNAVQLSQHLSNSIFLFSAGNNDYLANYLYPASNLSSVYNPQEFAQLLVDRLSQKLQMLYNLGARKAVLLEMGPLGCIPYVRGVAAQCDEYHNQNATIFNNQLASMVRNLTSTLSDFHLTRANFYMITEDVFTNPADYGFNDAMDPCCVTEENSPGCKRMTRPCSHPNGSLYFDGAHPTEAMVSLFASKCINDSSFCYPMNIQQLVQAETSSSYMHSAI